MTDTSDPRRGSENWFRDWFGTEYLELYPHRDEAEAARGVELFSRVSGSKPGDRVLDLACGAGRHLAPLRMAGYTPVGLDLSWTLLGRARELDPEALLVRGDMRGLPFRDAAFGGVASFFTSFGYFEAESQDLLVMREVRRVLRGDGTFMLDFLNAVRVRAELVAEDEREISGRRVRQLRRIEEGRVIKRIEISQPEDDDVRVFHESVRLYELAELEVHLEACGLYPGRLFGDYDGSEYGSASPRLIIVGNGTR